MSIERLKSVLADRYSIERELGAGGMATVYLARDLKHDRNVAIKVLRPELAAALGEERFLREITTTAGLRHPNILPLYDSGSAGGALYYVMPFVVGETLDDRLRRERRLPLHDALAIVREVADALGAAHAQGVVHRDIKPANLLLESGHAVVADFGIASAVQMAGGTKLTQAGMAVGTPVYMSPEQAAGGQQIDGRSDLYSLGCVLFELLVGEPPFNGPSAPSVLAQHLSTPAPALSSRAPGIPAPVAAIVSRLLAKEPDERYADARQLINAIDGALTPATTAAYLAAQRSAGRRSLLIPALIAILVLGGWALTRWWSGIDAAPAVTLRQLTSSVEVEEYPALSPDGARLLFSRDLGGIRQLFLVNIADGSERRVTRDSSDAIQPVWTPGGDAVVFVRARKPNTRLQPGDVFGEFSGGDIWRLTLASGAATRLVEEAATPSVAPDGRLAFDAARGGTRRIWVADSEGRNAQELSVDSSEAVAHSAPRWSPDGRWIVFQRHEHTRFDIGVIDVASHRTSQVTNDAYADLQPAWDPSGRAIWFTSNRAGGYNIWRIPVTRRGARGGPPVQITTGAGEDVELSVPSAGGRMAFSVLRLNADLWRLPVGPKDGRPTGTPELVVATTREESRGDWSPDSRRIAFNSDRSGEMNIWVHTLADSSDRQVTRGPGGDYQPRWSPDGGHVAFFSARAGNADIWSVDVATGQLTQLTTSPWLDINPAYSPDGSAIAFQSDRGGRIEVWTMKADGTDQRQLSQNGAGVLHFLVWSKDGKYLYFRDGNATASPGRIEVATGIVTPVGIHGGSHLSFNPDDTLLADVSGHTVLWISPLGGTPYESFHFDDPDIRVDYPVWSPDGRWILFDRLKPEGGDIWLMERHP